jgi:glutaredoxin 3
VQIWDMRSDKAAQAKANQYGITRVPAIVINGKLADCCATGAVNLTTLRRLGLGVA